MKLIQVEGRLSVTYGKGGKIEGARFYPEPITIQPKDIQEIVSISTKGTAYSDELEGVAIITRDHNYLFAKTTGTPISRDKMYYKLGEAIVNQRDNAILSAFLTRYYTTPLFVDYDKHGVLKRRELEQA